MNKQEIINVLEKYTDISLSKTVIEAHVEAIAAIKELEGFKEIGLTPEQLREVDKLYTEKCEELAQYKKLEAQGLLLQLPCKVGTQVYMINHYWIDEGFISGIAESDDVDCFCYKVYCDPDDYTMVAVADFNVTWFLTKEEAEAALKNY